jgi:hypothetical protein
VSEPFVDIDPTYENAMATCPACQARNIYNRRSDLKTLRPVDRASVTCESCGAAFAIGSDLINPAHKMLLLDCRPFFERKQYMQMVLGIAQAYEVFFNHFLHVRLVYRPGRDATPEELNELSERLYKKVKKLTFDPMRKVFLRLVLDGKDPQNAADARTFIDAIPGEAKPVPAVPRPDIEAVANDRLRPLLLGMLDANINSLRNKVVHKDAYRPTRDESWSAYEDACRVLFGLTAALRIRGSAEFYINGGDD